ncbi:MAG TPA: leucine-rich repeat domain-containing protein, partial [Acholeplasmataceae bacterium]|nr:leucine-rich repeat domain-containing protein [Acholeplasmataceae bacterium]
EEYDNEYNEQEDDHSEIYDSNKEYDENSNKLRIAIRKLEDSYKFKRSLEDLEFKFNRLLENMKLDAMPTKFIEDKKVYFILKDLNETLLKRLVDYIDEDGKFIELPEDFNEINDLLFYIKKFFKTEDLDVIGNLIYYAKDYLSTQDKVYLNSYLSNEGNLYAVEKQVKYYAFGEFDEYKDFDEDLPDINDIYDFDNFIKWLAIGVELKHYELMRVQMLIFMNGYGSITKDYIKAEKILRELLKLGDYTQNTNRYNMSYYSKYLAEILISRNEIALAIGEIYSTSLYPKYTFEEILPEYDLICEIIKNACFIYHGSWTDGEQEISFDRKKFDREIHVYNQLISMFESNEDSNIKFLKKYLEYLKRKQEYNKPEYVSMSYDDYYDPNPTEQELFEGNQMLDLEYKDVLEKINDIYESNWKRYNNFKYEIVGNEIIIRKYVGDLLEESIPEYIDGIAVTSIDEYVFYESKIEHIDLPKTMTKIGMHCFAKSNLKIINIPSEVKILEKYSFENCENLSEVVLGKSIEVIEEKCFSKCVNLASIKIPKSVMKLEWGCFESCASLKNILFEDESNLKIIEHDAFSNCDSLEIVNLPGSLYMIGSYSFANCTSLHTVILGVNTKNYSEQKCLSCGNILDKNNFCKDCYSKQDDNLDEYGAHIDVDSNLNHLYLLRGAFSGCVRLKKFSYNDDLIKIYDRVFSNTAFEQFEIRSTIKYIDGNPFDDCSNLIITCEEGVTRYGFKERFMTDNILVWKDIIKNNDAVNIEKSPFLDKNDDEIKEFYYYDGVIIAPVNVKRMVALPYGISSSLDVKAVLFSDNCLLEEIEQGAFDFSYESSLRMVRLPKDAPIQKIPKNLFSSKKDLSSVTLSSNIIEIGEEAFKNCVKLKEITLPKSLTTIGAEAFQSCKNLKKIKIHSAIEVIGERAFAYCEQLEQVNISTSSILKAINRMCFYECESLKEIILPNSVEVIYDQAFSKCKSLACLMLPESLEIIGSSSFSGCESLTKVEFNYQLKKVAVDSFDWEEVEVILGEKSNFKIEDGLLLSDDGKVLVLPLRKMETLTIPKSVTNIGGKAFYYSQLENVIIPDSVSDIGDRAFWGNSLTSVSLPNSVITIGERAFEHNKISSVTIPDSVMTIGPKAFDWEKVEVILGEKSNFKIEDDLLLARDGTFLVAGLGKLSNIIIPNTVLIIGDEAFFYNELTNVIIGNNVTKIGNHAFSRNKLTNVVIPNKVSVIGNYAFSENDLAEISIGNSVTYIGNNAFSENNI